MKHKLYDGPFTMRTNCSDKRDTMTQLPPSKELCFDRSFSQGQEKCIEKLYLSIDLKKQYLPLKEL